MENGIHQLKNDSNYMSQTLDIEIIMMTF